MEQLAAAAAAQGSDLGVGGHPLAGGGASRSEDRERTARRPAGALNPWLRAARARRPPGRRRVARDPLGSGGRGVRLRPEGTLLPGLGKGRGAKTMR